MRILQGALVGCGVIGEVHAQAYADYTDSSIKLVFCDTDDAKAELFNRRFGGIGYSTDLQNVLNNRSIQFVDLCLPHNLHSSSAVAALQSGKHVLLEKPIACNLMEADAILAAAQAAKGSLFMVAENYRMHPQIRQAVRLIESGTIGDPFLIQVSAHMFWKVSGWRTNRMESGGGALLDSGIHLIDTLIQLGGKVQKLYAQMITKTIPMQGEDTCVLCITFCNHVLGQLSLTYGATRNPSWPAMSFSIYGTQGSIFSFEQLKLVKPSARGHGFDETILLDKNVPDYLSVQSTVRHFVDCLVGRATPAWDSYQMRYNLEIACAAYSSAEKQQVVDLNYCSTSERSSNATSPELV